MPTLLGEDRFDTGGTWAASAGSPLIVPTPAPISIPTQRALRCSSIGDYVYWNIPDAGHTRLVFGVWAYFEALPVTSQTRFFKIDQGTTEGWARIETSGEVDIAGDGSPTLAGANTGAFLSAARWHWVQLMFDVSANPWQLRFKEGATVASITGAASASNLDAGIFLLGNTSGGEARTVYYANPMWGVAANDDDWWPEPGAFPRFKHRVLTDFNGTDQTPLSDSGKWLQYSDAPTTAARVSNAMTGSGSDYFEARWEPELFTPPYEVIVPIRTWSDTIAMGFSLTEAASYAGRYGYSFIINQGGAGVMSAALERHDGSPTTLASNDVDPHPVSGDAVGFEYLANGTMRVYVRRSGVWDECLEARDIDQYQAGKISLGGFGTAVRFEEVTVGVPEPVPTASRYLAEVLSETSLVAFYPLNDRLTRDPANLIARGEFGTWSASGADDLVSLVPGRPGIIPNRLSYCCSFDRTVPGAIDFGDTYDFAGRSPFSIELWIRPDVLDGTVNYIASKEDGTSGWALEMWNAGLRFRRIASGGQDAAVGAPLSVGQIYHIVADYDGDLLDLYVNGAGVANGVVSTRSLPGNTASHRLGCSNIGSDGISAKVQDYALYDAPLGVHRAIAHYNAGMAAGDIPLYWDWQWITDDDRALGSDGDGRPPEGSTGMWTQRINEIPNGGFERSTSDWTTIGSTLTRVSTHKRFGGFSGQVTTAGSVAGEGIRSSNLYLNPSNAENFCAWVRAPKGALLELVIEERNSINTVLSTTVHRFGGTGEWQREYVHMLANAAGDHARVYVRTANTAQAITFQVDGAQFEWSLNGTLRRGPTPYKESHDDGPYEHGHSRLSVAKEDVPSTFFNQGWFACRWRASKPDPLREGENSGLFQVGAPPNRWTFYYTGLHAASLTTEDASGTATEAWNLPSQGGEERFTAVAAWTPTQQKISTNGSAFQGIITRETPVISGGWQIDVFSLYQWFAGTLDGEAFWFAMGIGALSDADAALLAALPDNPIGRPPLPGDPFIFWDGTSKDAYAYLGGQVRPMQVA